MISDFKARNQPIIFYNTHSSVLDTFLGANVEEFTVVHSLEELHNHLHSLICNTSDTEECHRLRNETGAGDVNINNVHNPTYGEGTTEDPPIYNEISIISNSQSPGNGTTA
jgi:hypothetical protein